MKLFKARVQNYRSIIDTGEFEIESLKTIMVGPNEAGKTLILKALQQLNKPADVPGFDVLRDYPRSLYEEISSGKVIAKDVTVVTGYFKLEQSDRDLLPDEFKDCIYKRYKNIDNQIYHTVENAPPLVYYKDIKSDLLRLVAHFDKQFLAGNPADETRTPGKLYNSLVDNWKDLTLLSDDYSSRLKNLLVGHYSLIEEGNEKEEARYAKLMDQIEFYKKREEALDILAERKPIFILFNNYFKVKPSVHLEHLAMRTEQKLLDDEYYDYGNLCLLKLLGFTARQLANLGNAPSPDMKDKEALKEYKDRLDSRSYQLNAASAKLTQEIRRVWMPDPNRPEADKLKVTADGQYLKVVVEDDIGVDIELDQRSEGFQWIVSFFVVFFAEAMGKHKNAILLLDEPGTSLHPLKQRDFRETISRLAEKNQTIYTTHSPFLVGPDELDIVKIIEMKDRREGTKVQTLLSSSDPAGLLPLKEALGYDLAQGLFSQKKNLIVEGISDYWYVESTIALLKAAKMESLQDEIALVFANTSGKVVYYATILFAHQLKVVALLDSDATGNQAEQQDNLVYFLGNENILRSKDFIKGISKPSIEDLLRSTLVSIVKTEYETDLTEIAAIHPEKPITEIFKEEIPDFSKYALAKSYVKWTNTHDATALSKEEQSAWISFIQQVNKSLK